MPCLTELPNELWLIILSYLNIVDIFRAFHNFDERFNKLVYDSARHITLLSDITSDWLEEHLSPLENRVKILCLHANALPFVFGKTWSFPNLRLINLQGTEWNMSLRIEKEPISVILSSSLIFVNSFSILLDQLLMQNHLIHNVDDYNETLSCPYIERLSVTIYFGRSLSAIRTGTPNLLHLKITYVDSGWNNFSLIEKLDPIETPTRLVTLHIQTNTVIDCHLLEHIITSYKTSLQNLELDVRCLQPIDGYYLESIFKSCQHLKKLVFFFLHSYTVEREECLSSFQSEWWLDTHRPAVYIQPNETNDTIIASIPFYRSFIFRNGLYNWYLNKGDRNSSFIRFNTDQIHFTNKTHQPINLEYLYSINRLFTSSNQSLTFNFCNLETVDYLFYLFMDEPLLAPSLPKVKRFIVGSQNRLSSLMLCVWILLMPNLQELDISKLTTFNKTEFTKELTDLIAQHECLQPSFNHINKLILFSQCHANDIETKEKLFRTFQNIFMNASIC